MFHSLITFTDRPETPCLSGVFGDTIIGFRVVGSAFEIRMVHPSEKFWSEVCFGRFNAKYGPSFKTVSVAQRPRRDTPRSARINCVSHGFTVYVR